MEGLRIAVCHEWITTFGGSEQVAQRLARVLDASDVFTFTARPAMAQELFPGRRVHVHRLGRAPSTTEHWQRFLPVMPLAWSRLDLRGYDVVVTSSHAATNAIRVPDGTLHISYCHTPMRYAWEWRSEIGRVPVPLRPVWPLVAAGLRRADRSWSRRVDRFVANSQHVAARIRKAYGRRSDVVYPPVDVSFWTPSTEGRRDEYLLLAGRLVAYKRPVVAVQAAEIANVPLVVAGDGPEIDRVRRIAGRDVEIVRSPSREELRELYRGARALVVPGIEDFGMTMVEAQACGTPVIALGIGGAREAVTSGRSGFLYRDATAAGLAEVLRRFDADAFDPIEVRRQAERFDESAFDERIRAIVAEATELEVAA